MLGSEVECCIRMLTTITANYYNPICANIPLKSVTKSAKPSPFPCLLSSLFQLHGLFEYDGVIIVNLMIAASNKLYSKKVRWTYS